MAFVAALGDSFGRRKKKLEGSDSRRVRGTLRGRGAFGI
jgi:hypothetical protein